MRSKKVYRYYCDFCTKSGCNAGHIRKHEIRCTRNPSRECRMCREAAGEEALGPYASMDALVSAVDPMDATELRQVARGCPACMLAGILEWKRREEAAGAGPEDLWVDFDFKKETEQMWNRISCERWEFSAQHQEETLAGLSDEWPF